MAKTQTTALALLFALAAPLSAQTTEAPATEDPATEASPADDLAMGVPAEKTGPYVKANFEAWEQRCMKTDSGIEPCELYTLLKDDQGSAVAEFSIYGLPPGTEGPAVAGANFMAPLETLLTAGISLQIDAAEAKAYPFSVCSTAGCMARLGFTAEEIEALKQGGEVTITLVPYIAPDQKVTLKMSLKGFTAGLEAVNASNKLADEAAAAAAAAAGAEATTTP